MSHTKIAPEELKPQECERDTGRSRPPIPYIPEKDVIQEAVDSSTNTLKLMLPHKVELCVPVWLKGTPEQFLVHFQQVLNAIRQKGLQTALEKAIKEKEECTKKLVEAKEALANYKGRDKNLAGNVGVASRRQDPPNDMSSRHLPTCRRHVENVGPTFGKKMSFEHAKRHVV